jgi:hypothetical protein
MDGGGRRRSLRRARRDRRVEPIGDGAAPHAGAAIAAIAAIAGDSARRADAIAALSRVSDA